MLYALTKNYLREISFCLCCLRFYFKLDRMNAKIAGTSCKPCEVRTFDIIKCTAELSDEKIEKWFAEEKLVNLEQMKAAIFAVKHFNPQFHLDKSSDSDVIIVDDDVKPKTATIGQNVELCLRLTERQLLKQILSESSLKSSSANPTSTSTTTVKSESINKSVPQHGSGIKLEHDVQKLPSPRKISETVAKKLSESMSKKSTSSHSSKKSPRVSESGASLLGKSSKPSPSQTKTYLKESVPFFMSTTVVKATERPSSSSLSLVEPHRKHKILPGSSVESPKKQKSSSTLESEMTVRKELSKKKIAASPQKVKHKILSPSQKSKLSHLPLQKPKHNTSSGKPAAKSFLEGDCWQQKYESMAREKGRVEKELCTVRGNYIALVQRNQVKSCFGKKDFACQCDFLTKPAEKEMKSGDLSRFVVTSPSTDEANKHLENFANMRKPHGTDYAAECDALRKENWRLKRLLENKKGNSSSNASASIFPESRSTVESAGYKELEAELHDAQQECIERGEVIEDLEQQLNSLCDRQRILQMEGDLSKALERNDKLESELDVVTEKRRELEWENGNLKQENDNLKSHIVETIVDRDVPQKLKECLYSSTVDRLSKQVDNLKAQLQFHLANTNNNVVD